MSDETITIPMPPRRTLTRLVLPAALVGAALAALAVTSWRGLLPAAEVDVVPVSMRAVGAPDPQAQPGPPLVCSPQWHAARWPATAASHHRTARAGW